MRQLCKENGRLDFIKSGINTRVFVHVFLFGAVITKGPYHLGKLQVVGDYGTPIAHGSQIFCRVKTVGCGNTWHTTSQHGTMSLGCVFEHLQIVCFRKFTNRGHIRQTTIQVNNQNSTGLFGTGIRQASNIQITGFWVRLNKNRHKPRRTNRKNCRYKSICRHNDLIPFGQTSQNNGGLQHQGKSIKAVPHTDTRLFATIGSKSFFEGRAMRTANIPV